MSVTWSKSDNVEHAKSLIDEAAKNGAKLVVLPGFTSDQQLRPFTDEKSDERWRNQEYFTCAMHPKEILSNSEPPYGETSLLMSELAKKHDIFLVGGSLPIRDQGGLNKVRNTCYIYNPKGEIIGEHSKIHMFDVNLGPRLHITESKITVPGQSLTCFDTGVCKVGVGVCMDIQYPEVSRIYAKRGCKLLIFPGASSARTTGPAHWEVLQRARAIDNQVYVVTASPARDDTHPYVVHGFSAIVNPWGEIISSAKQDEQIVYADLDMDFLDEIRTNIPMEKNRRKDMYKVVDLSS